MEKPFASASLPEKIAIGTAALVSKGDWWEIVEARAVDIFGKAVNGAVPIETMRGEIRHLRELRGLPPVSLKSDFHYAVGEMKMLLDDLPNGSGAEASKSAILVMNLLEDPTFASKDIYLIQPLFKDFLSLVTAIPPADLPGGFPRIAQDLGISASAMSSFFMMREPPAPTPVSPDDISSARAVRDHLPQVLKVSNWWNLTERQVVSRVLEGAGSASASVNTDHVRAAFRRMCESYGHGDGFTPSPKSVLHDALDTFEDALLDCKLPNGRGAHEIAVETRNVMEDTGFGERLLEDDEAYLPALAQHMETAESYLTKFAITKDEERRVSEARIAVFAAMENIEPDESPRP